MKPRFYIDEDSMENNLIKAFRQRSLDILTVQESGMRGRTDEEQLEYPISLGRVIYTSNVADFCRLHADYLLQGKNHAGIVVVPKRGIPVGEQLRRLAKLAIAKTAEEFQNELVFLRS